MHETRPAIRLKSGKSNVTHFSRIGIQVPVPYVILYSFMQVVCCSCARGDCRCEAGNVKAGQSCLPPVRPTMVKVHTNNTQHTRGLSNLHVHRSLPVATYGSEQNQFTEDSKNILLTNYE